MSFPDRLRHCGGAQKEPRRNDVQCSKERNRILGGVSFLVVQSLILIIRLYQLLLSPLLGECCRFYPSCSRYAVEALRLHGFFKGAWLSLKRVIRCHPWCDGGVDPVPIRSDKKVSGYP